MKTSLYVDPQTTLKDALKRLDDSTYGVLLVVDDDKVLQGTLTDGDARRAILAGKPLDAPIADVFNPSPHCLRADGPDIELARKWFLDEHFHLIPLVDEKGRVSDVLTWDRFLGGDNAEPGKRPKMHIDVPVVIMAGGKGTRLEPFTHVLPKPLVPVADRTILQLIIDGFREVGVKQFLLTLNYRAEMIRAYMDGIDKDYAVSYWQEKTFSGTAGSLRLLEDALHEDFIVSNCDIIVEADWADILKFHRQSGAALTIVSSMQNYQIPYGVIEFLPGGRVSAIVEKPEYTFPINTGVYILHKRCLQLIPENTVYHMTDLIAGLLAQKQIVITYPVNEHQYKDIGQWDEYRATLDKLRV
jgi:dTDP-glucose pyrophosphorylase